MVTQISVTHTDQTDFHLRLWNAKDDGILNGSDNLFQHFEAHVGLMFRVLYKRICWRWIT